MYDHMGKHRCKACALLFVVCSEVQHCDWYVVLLLAAVLAAHHMLSFLQQQVEPRPDIHCLSPDKHAKPQGYNSMKRKQCSTCQD